MIGILQCGDPPAGLRTEFGSCGAMVERLLGPGRDAKIFDVTKGELPAVPRLATPMC